MLFRDSETLGSNSEAASSVSTRPSMGMLSLLCIALPLRAVQAQQDLPFGVGLRLWPTLCLYETQHSELLLQTGCTNETMEECLRDLVFGLPRAHWCYVQASCPVLQMALFHWRPLCFTWNYSRWPICSGLPVACRFSFSTVSFCFTCFIAALSGPFVADFISWV